MRVLSADKTRCVTDEHGGVFGGLVGYEGEVRDGEWTGRKARLFFDDENAAEAWLTESAHRA